MLKGIGAAVENIHHESSQTPSVTTSPAHPPRSRLSRITTSYHGISSRHNSQKAQMPSMFFVERFPCFPVYQTAHQTAPELLQSGHRSERSRHHQTWFDRWITQENASVTKLVGDVSRCIQMYPESRCDISPNGSWSTPAEIMPLHKSSGESKMRRIMFPKCSPNAQDCTIKSKSWKASDYKNTPGVAKSSFLCTGCLCPSAPVAPRQRSTGKGQDLKTERFQLA